MKIEFKKIYTISNFISFFRVLLAIPIFFYIRDINEITGARYILFGLYMLAFLSDIADGYFARKFDEVSELGKIIDPLADKILTILVVIYLYYFDIIPDYYFWIIVLRDALIFLGGLFISRQIGRVLPSNYLGKITVLSIGLFIITVTLGASPDGFAYQFFHYLSLILSFSSIILYGYRGFKELKKVKNEVI